MCAAAVGRRTRGTHLSDFVAITNGFESKKKMDLNRLRLFFKISKSQGCSREGVEQFYWT
jgi:hypothetical protein